MVSLLWLASWGSRIPLGTLNGAHTFPKSEGSVLAITGHLTAGSQVGIQIGSPSFCPRDTGFPRAESVPILPLGFREPVQLGGPCPGGDGTTSSLLWERLFGLKSGKRSSQEKLWSEIRAAQARGQHCGAAIVTQHR